MLMKQLSASMLALLSTCAFATECKVKQKLIGPNEFSVEFTDSSCFEHYIETGNQKLQEINNKIDSMNQILTSKANLTEVNKQLDLVNQTLTSKASQNKVNEQLDSLNNNLKTNYLTATQIDDNNITKQNEVKEWAQQNFTASSDVNQSIENYLRQIPDILEINFAPSCSNHTVFLSTITQGNHNPLVQGNNYTAIKNTSHPFFLVVSQQNSDSNFPHGVSISVDHLENDLNKLVITRQGGVRENWSGAALFPEETPAGKTVLMNRNLVIKTDTLDSVDQRLQAVVGHADADHPYGYVTINCIS